MQNSPSRSDRKTSGFLLLIRESSLYIYWNDPFQFTTASSFWGIFNFLYQFTAEDFLPTLGIFYLPHYPSSYPAYNWTAHSRAYILSLVLGNRDFLWVYWGNSFPGISLLIGIYFEILTN